MEPTLHMKQGLNLLDRILQFYPLMQEGDTATVELTEQDWMVLYDFTENPDGVEVRPAAIREMTVDRPTRTIILTTNDCTVSVKMA
ncbi:MAG TPA: hypothetical protein VHI13_06290 [Candidatus Kapabacteria bacterium]|nr:hypothetical protein [Candidatus Kapabacteria bacterium]